MGFTKFNTQSAGKYYRNYLKRDTEFYAAIRMHLSKYLGKKKSRGIDIGAGPGIGAMICSSLGLSTVLVGYEPSRTFYDGKKLSVTLQAKKNPVNYSTVRKGIKAISKPKKDSLDYILILRAAHEIADTLGSKSKFFSEVNRISEGLKKSGVLIIADAEYSEPISSNVKRGHAIIGAVMAYQEKHIGHSHKPSDYFTHQEMEKSLSALGFVKVKETMLPNNDLLKVLVKQGIAIKKSPLSFYVQTYRRT